MVCNKPPFTFLRSVEHLWGWPLKSTWKLKTVLKKLLFEIKCVSVMFAQIKKKKQHVLDSFLSLKALPLVSTHLLSGTELSHSLSCPLNPQTKPHKKIADYTVVPSGKKRRVPPVPTMSTHTNTVSFKTLLLLPARWKRRGGG